MRAEVMAAALVGLAACQPAPHAPGDGEGEAAEAVAPNALTANGWGPLRIGMSRAQVVAAAGEDRHPEAVGGPDPDECDEFRPSRAPDGMIVMVERGRLTRISLVAGSDVRTEDGFAVGDPAPAIKAAYGASAVVRPHKYLPAPAEYIIVRRADDSGDNARGLVYETGVDRRVTHIRAGGPSIEYVEGCL